MGLGGSSATAAVGVTGAAAEGMVGSVWNVIRGLGGDVGWCMSCAVRDCWRQRPGVGSLARGALDFWVVFDRRLDENSQVKEFTSDLVRSREEKRLLGESRHPFGPD